MNIYETDRLVSEYLLFHYGKEDEILPWAKGPKEALGFPLRTVAHFSEGHVARALDLGCAVGRSTFALGENADEVIGIDYSAAFIDAANRILSGENLGYSQHIQAGKFSELQVLANEFVKEANVSFEVGDAMNLRDDLGSFDRVHAANLICRLPEPLKLIDRLPSLVKQDGELVLATPCTWLEEFTPSRNWPEDGDTFAWLQKVLGEHFDLIHQADEPFLIRETERKFQWTVSLVSKWKRKSS